MRKLNLLFSLFFGFLFSFSLQAQDLEYGDYDWEKNPAVHKLTEKEKEMAEILLKEKVAIEYAYEPSGELMEYTLRHTIRRVNSDKAIEENNKIYIPGNIEFIKHKVRVINPDGKVRELSKADVKEAVDEESNTKYTFFALEGISLGSEIEHLVITKTDPNYTGAREIIQEDILKKNIEFELFSPINLTFKIKSYNDLPVVARDSTREDKNAYLLKLASVDGLEKEESAAYRANLQQLVYKLDGNTATGAKDIVSYGAVSNNIFNNICVVSDKKVKKQVKKLISNINIKYARNEEDKIRIIEQYLKANFTVIDNYVPALNDLSAILEHKVAHKNSMIKLYSEIFNQMELEYQLVLTTDRKSLRFDPEFEAYNFLGSYLLYIPFVDKYLDPSNVYSCLGFIPAEYSNNYGLFIKKVSLNDFVTGIGEVRLIEPLSYDLNYSNHFVTVKFTDEITKPVIKMENHLSGYYAQYYQPFYSLMGEDDIKKFNESIIENYMDNVVTTDMQVENAGRDFFGIKPFIVKADLTSDFLVEKAGTKFLFKVGLLIGPQMEMYQEQKRKLEIENDFNRLYVRQIVFELPAGYKISNPEALNLDVYKEENGERVISFKSTYKVEGNKYIIDVEEYYKQLNFPVSEYDTYRKVINAAADFNKITLIIEKTL